MVRHVRAGQRRRVRPAGMAVLRAGRLRLLLRRLLGRVGHLSGCHGNDLRDGRGLSPEPPPRGRHHQTLRDGIAHHYTASLATLETAASNRGARLLDYYDFRRSAIDEARTDRMKRVVLASGGDASMLAHVVGLLLRNGIEVTRLKQAATSS